MKIGGIEVPPEVIHTMPCTNKVVSFDFKNPNYKDLAAELMKPKYDMRLDVGHTRDEVHISKISGVLLPNVQPTLDKFAKLTPGHIPWAEDSTIKIFGADNHSKR